MFFSDTGGIAERGAPYYIHTRVRRADAGGCTREMKRKYGEEQRKDKGNTDWESNEKGKKDGGKGRKEDGVKGNI